jgi:hypothetical protein
LERGAVGLRTGGASDATTEPERVFAAGSTFAGSWLVFELMRRVPLLRPLFGLKATPPAAPAPALAEARG